MPATPSKSTTAPHIEIEPSSKPIMGWVSAILLILFFAGALMVYPPTLDASSPMPMPDWAKMIGRFHVVALHLPVGVLMLAMFMELVCFISRKNRVYLNPATTFTLHIAGWGAAIAVVMGILLSRKGGFGSPLFQAHQWLGLVAAVGIIITLLMKLLVDGSGDLRWIYRGTFGLTVLVLSVGAHFGGNLVHGGDYLIKYAPPNIRDAVASSEDMILDQFKKLSPTKEVDATPPAPEPADAPPAAKEKEGTVYAALVAPVLQSKCTSCHNADKSKAGLRLDTHELLFKGSENGEVLVVGKPEKSKIIGSLNLPLDDDDHMPPPKEKQPTKEEIELLTWWIKEGASVDLKVADAKFPDSIKSLVEEKLGKAKGGSAGGAPPLFLALAEAPAQGADIAVAEAMRKINGSGASLAPLAADSQELRFTALNIAKDFKDAGLKDLEPIADKIVALDVAKSAVTDAGLASIAKMTHLRELHLEGTAITDAGVAQLKGLAQLEYLNVYGTKVTDKALADLAGLEKLKSLYAWQTGVTKEGVLAFKAKHPAATVNTGWTEADNAKVVASAPAPAPAPAPAKPEAPKPAAPTPAPAATVAAATPKPAPAPVAPAPAPAKPEAPKLAAPAPASAVAAAAPAPATSASNPNAVLFKDIVAPILEAKCTKCHGTEKSKGKLRLNKLADILKGGSDGATTAIPGKPADSLMIKRPKLADDDDDHMPPKDEPQLTKDEIALLAWWIEQGATDTLTVAAAKKTPEIEAALKAFAAAGPVHGGSSGQASAKPKAKPLTPEEKKAVAQVAAKMTALNASLMPLALDTEQLRFGCVNAADKFGDKELDLLTPIATQVLWVDLARSKVTDAGCATLAKLTNLERLHLENTALTDAGVEQLSGLQHLEYLNLYGTKVSDAGLAKLAGIKSLKKLFVWQTAATKDGAKKLEAAVPGLVVNVGLSEAEIAKLVEEAKPPVSAVPPAKADKAEKKKEKKEKAAAAAAAATPPAPAKTEPAKTEPAKPEAPATPPPAPKPEAKPAPAPAPTAAVPAPAAKPAPQN